MLGKFIKNFGRRFFILTNEHEEVKPADIKTLLLVKLPGENHFKNAVGSIYKRWGRVKITFLCPESDVNSFSSMGEEEVIGYKVRILNIGLAGLLRELKESQYSAVVILSLPAHLLALAFLNFRCYKLLYNKWDRWYLIRKRTFFEFFTGVKGADENVPENTARIVINWQGKTGFLKMAYISFHIMARFMHILWKGAYFFIGSIYLLFSVGRLFLRRLKRRYV